MSATGLKKPFIPDYWNVPVAVTRGTLYFDLDLRSMRLLDCFEGKTYCRRTIAATTIGGDKHIAEVYLISPEYHHVLDACAWDPRVFETKHLESYLKRCRKFYKMHKYRYKSVA